VKYLPGMNEGNHNKPVRTENWLALLCT